MIGTTASPSLNPFGMLWDVFYGTAESMTGMVGLTPLQVAAGALGLVGLLLLWQVYCGLRGRTSFSVYPDADGS